MRSGEARPVIPSVMEGKRGFSILIDRQGGSNVEF